MKKCISVFLVFFVLASTISGIMPFSERTVNASGETQSNLIPNPGFEQTVNDPAWKNSIAPAGWGVWFATAGGVVSVDTAVYHSGMNSVKIDQTKSSRTDVSVKGGVAVTPGRNYKVGIWIKTQNVSSNGVVFRTFYYNGSTYIGNGPTSRMTGTNDWTYKELLISVPTNASNVRVEVMFETGTGIVWIDDAKAMEYIPVTGLELSSKFGIVKVGDNLNLAASVIPANANNQGILWTSDNPGVAVVSEGVITGIAEGNTTITATTEESGFSQKFLVYVSNTEMETLPPKTFSFSVDEDGTINGTLDKTDANGNALTYSVFEYASNGLSRVDSNGGFQYSPNKDFYGTDKFKVIAVNGAGGIGLYDITITVNTVNDAPASGETTVGVVQGSSVNGKVAATDTDKDSIAYVISSSPSKGTVTLTPEGDFTYKANEDSTGEDRFVVAAGDNKGGSSLYTVNVFIATQGQKMINTLKSVSANQLHPRINAGKETFDHLKFLLENNDIYITRWFNNVKAVSDTLLTQPPKEYEIPDGLRLLEVSREVLRRTRYLSMAYRMTGDSRYAERLWTELDKAGNFQDWNSSRHFLDTAEMTNAFGTAYDWLYDYWSPDRKSFIVKSIKEKGLIPGINAYNKGEWWTKGVNNWNGVCNGGLAVGALAVGDETDIDPAIEGIAAAILENAVKGLPYMLSEYKPDGAWNEGPGYWDYGTSYTVYMLSSMFQALGTDYGLSELPCMGITTDFPIYNNGAVGSYNFADAGAGIVRSPIMLWFGTRYNNPSYYWTHRVSGTDTGDPMSMLWYPGLEKYNADAPPEKLDKKFGYVEVGTMRSNWYDSKGTFLGFKGGYNQFPHGDLDEGSFVYDAYGVRWAVDLGAGNYNAPGYWEMGVSGGRWKYYRKRAEGHNTFVINPGNYPDQNVFARAKIEKFETNSNQTAALSIIDLSETYNKDAFSAKRGLFLANNKTELLVQDEVRNRKPSDYWWFMHTDSAIEISADRKSAVLGNQGKRLYVQLLSEEGRFSVMDAVPLPTSPVADQQPNSGIRKLVVHIENALDVNLAVRMVPLMSTDEIPKDKPAVVSLDNWKVQEESLLLIDGLSVAGTPVQNFNKYDKTYRVILPYGTTSVPTVEAKASDPDLNADVKLPDALPGLAKVTVTSKTNADIKNSYYIELLSDKGITASTSQEGNWPENSMDGNLITRWAAEGDQWIQYYIGEEQVVEGISIAYFRGNERKYMFDILLSEDGEHWEEVLSGVQTSGTAADLVRYDFPEMKRAKYVRILGHGSNANRWNNIAEVNIHKLSICDPRYDQEAPVITQSGPLTMKQTVQEEVYFSISDSKSGLKYSRILLDGVESTEKIVIEPLSMKLGIHTIKVEAEDRAGNRVEKTYPLEIIIEESDLITMLDLGYIKGYITDKGIYNSLHAKLKQDQPEKQNENSDVNRLNALKNETMAQKGKKIDAAFAELLIEAIDYVVGR